MIFIGLELFVLIFGEIVKLGLVFIVCNVRCCFLESLDNIEWVFEDLIWLIGFLVSILNGIVVENKMLVVIILVIKWFFFFMYRFLVIYIFKNYFFMLVVCLVWNV